MPVTTPAHCSQPPQSRSDEFLLLDGLDLHSLDSKEPVRLEAHDIITAPLLSRDAIDFVKDDFNSSQYGVMGRLITTCDKSSSQIPNDPRLYLNTNAPFSALVCGVQGSGKSHSVSVMLENMFIRDCPSLGHLGKPLAGLVLHFGEGGRPCEAAWLAVSNKEFGTILTPPVCVYVSKSSLNTMKQVYEPLGEAVEVKPLLFKEDELDAQAFLSMMAIGTSEGAPLYIQAVLAILRELGESYTYGGFLRELEIQKAKFNPAQRSGLEQRLSLLNSFTKSSNLSLNGKKGCSTRKGSRFSPGQITIVDLSDPFIDAASACGLFEIVTRLFVRAEVSSGKVLVVDEAHKYLSKGTASRGLTEALSSLCRQQRHLAMRLIISTQGIWARLNSILQSQPSQILDLCSVVMIHRFSSPSWWEHVMKHVAADFSGGESLDQIVRLQTGQAIVLAPSALITQTPHNRELSQLGRRHMLIKTRRRLTRDGGASILAIS